MSVQKPDMRRAWATLGAVVPPDPAKIDAGWTAEKPPFQTENWIQQRSDFFMQHTNIEGIPQWDVDSAYELNSIVKGSNGLVYKSKVAVNLGINPTADVLGNWEVCPQRATEIIDLVYPVNSVYTSVSNVNPATLFGIGTWVPFGEGRVLVGQQTADPLFDTPEEIGGSKDAVVVSHNHTSSANGAHTHGLGNGVVVTTQGNVSPYDPLSGSSPSGRPRNEVSAGNHTHTINSNGVSGVEKNLQPYIVVHFWKRTA